MFVVSDELRSNVNDVKREFRKQCQNIVDGSEESNKKISEKIVINIIIIDTLSFIVNYK